MTRMSARMRGRGKVCMSLGNHGSFVYMLIPSLQSLLPHSSAVLMVDYTQHCTTTTRLLVAKAEPTAVATSSSNMSSLPHNSRSCLYTICNGQ